MTQINGALFLSLYFSLPLHLKNRYPLSKDWIFLFIEIKSFQSRHSHSRRRGERLSGQRVGAAGREIHLFYNTRKKKPREYIQGKS